MGAANSIQSLLAKFARLFVRRQDLDFACGDCERSDRCGLTPSRTCIIREAQIARGDWKSKRRSKIAIGW